VVHKLIDEYPFLMGEQRSHAVALNLYRLIKENDDDERDAMAISRSRVQTRPS